MSFLVMGDYRCTYISKFHSLLYCVLLLPTAVNCCFVLQFYQIAILYMATRLFCNLSQAYVPIYLQDSLHLQEESVAYIPLVMYVSGFLTTTGMRALNKYIGRKVSVYIMCCSGKGERERMMLKCFVARHHTNSRYISVCQSSSKCRDAVESPVNP